MFQNKLHDNKVSLSDKINKARIDRQFVRLFLNDNQFKIATEKSVLVQIGEFKFGIASTMAAFQQKSKNGKIYSSITVNRNGTYKPLQTTKNDKGEYENVELAEISGQELINYYFSLKQN